MNSSDWRKAREIIPIAKNLPSGEQNLYLQRACGEDVNLRREIELLLAADLDRVAFLERPLFQTFGSRASMEGQRLGPYRIVEELGHGGMGTVYLAVRADEAFEGKVAVKVLRPDLGSHEVEWRFRQEIQILANLNHPNIAKLYEVGFTEPGTPYLIMEYVEGVPITQFCEEQRFAVSERLNLFRKVCRAAQYAHHNLVVHLDLKPSNILVTASGEPKLLDFGIAKLLPSTNSSDDPMTVTELHFFTPEYASPEQVSGHQITTASDVYSLGVLLYELLSGDRPYHLKGRNEGEIRQIICERVPEAPSLAAVRPRIGARAPAISQETDLRKWSRQLQGDLDTIVLMALRKEPERRYNSPEQLTEDIERYLRGLPVRAQRDTFSYRAAKFSRRNMLPLSVSALLITLVIMATLLIWQQRQRAFRERDRAQRVADLLVQVLNTVDPSSEPISALDVLDRGVRAIKSELASQPELRADLLQTLGDVYTSWGSYDQAASILNEALAIRRLNHGPGSSEIAETLYSLGVVAFHQRNFENAETLLHDSLRIRTEALGDDAPELADNLIALGLLYKERGDLSRTEQLYLKALNLRRRALGSDHPEVGDSHAQSRRILP